MELSHKDGKLRVYYSDKLVSLLREVRQLAAFGFVIPSKIQQVSNTAQKFYKHGVILKQVKYTIECVSTQRFVPILAVLIPLFPRLLISTTLLTSR